LAPRLQPHRRRSPKAPSRTTSLNGSCVAFGLPSREYCPDLHRRFRCISAFVGSAFVGLRTCWFLNISNEGQAIATSSLCRIKRTHVYVRDSGKFRSANLAETSGPI
jgi:hypothetical protein